MLDIKRDFENKKIVLYDNGEKVFETGRIGAEFILCLYTNNPIVITKDVDECLYMNLSGLFENKYVFAKDWLSSKTENRIVWFSDVACDIENPVEVDSVNRLIIDKFDDEIQISYVNPFCEKCGIEKSYGNSFCEECGIKKSIAVIAFSPAGNGFVTKNIDTGSSFQDDVVLAFRRALMREVDASNREKRFSSKMSKKSAMDKMVDMFRDYVSSRKDENNVPIINAKTLVKKNNKPYKF